ncbi:MAG TPA: DsbC family protein [Syntrophorhabdaceae bacterium]|jgi:thiol:disulfide interchange protein DsbC
MKKKGFIAVLIMVFVYAFTLSALAQTTDTGKKGKGGKASKQKVEKQESAEETFKKMFPQVKIDSIQPTDIKGIYEITSGPNIAYFAPDPGYLIVGEIRDRTGVSLTAKRREQLQAATYGTMAVKAKELPLDKAVKIGEGKGKVIEFTDPDCPYCRKASEFFNKQKDVTRYVFFMPLPNHPDAENKVRYVFCATDKAAAYEEAMTGKLDGKKYEVCKTPEVDGLLALHKEWAVKLGINSTPFFIVNDQVVSGADIPKLEQALKQNSK